VIGKVTGGAGLEGQWIGTADGANAGLVVVDLDLMGSHYSGHAYLFEDDPNAPSTLARLRTIDLDNRQFLAKCELAALHPTLPHVVSRDDLGRDFPDVQFPTTADIRFELQSEGLAAEWETDIGTSGRAILQRSQADQPSLLRPVDGLTSWSDFKNYALDLPPRQYIFRGQDCTKRLRTSFHRTRRKDLVTYLTADMPHAHHVLTARTRHLFNLGNPIENGAFLNLLQHHGYPTPLLDWSYSPFVAAFFAYRFRRVRDPEDNVVRIFCFDKGAWERDFQQIQSLAFARMHFSLMEALTIENPRAMPQQSVSSVTNLDDIETYIVAQQQRTGNEYLKVIDLPFAERRKVMEELSLMGITAGSLFPGLDGACEEMRGRYFHPFD
jgi:hypothetical protein